MAFYSDAKTFYSVMGDLFREVLEQPQLLKPLRRAHAVVRIKTTQPDAMLVLDASVEPPRFLVGQPANGKVDLGLQTAADTLHEVWLNEIRLRDAYGNGQMRLDTNPLKAMALMPSLMELFRYVESIYERVLRERGML